MPHKRAKHVIREQTRSRKSVNSILSRSDSHIKPHFTRGNDLAPGKFALSDESIPNSAARVLNAAKIQGDWKSKRSHHERDLTEDAGVGNAKRRKLIGRDRDRGPPETAVSFAIQPGETLRQFNKCVQLNPAVIVSSFLFCSQNFQEGRRRDAARREFNHTSVVESWPKTTETPISSSSATPLGCQRV
jgi:hypothetical protein